MKVSLTRGFTAIVDIETASRLLSERKRCYVVVQQGTPRAYLHDRGAPRLLASWILGNVQRKRIRYSNGDPMDCRRENLSVGPIIRKRVRRRVRRRIRKRVGRRIVGPVILKEHNFATLDLTQNRKAIVDLPDADRLETLGARWQAVARQGTFYAMSDIGDPKRRVYLHRWIMEAPKGSYVDHENGNGLDNRRSNLRFVTHADNLRNHHNRKPGASGFFGVAAIKASSSWRAYTNHNDRQVQIGVWPTAELAASARDLYVAERHPTSTLNFPDGPPHGADEVARTKISKTLSPHPGIRFKQGVWEVWVRRDGERIYVGRYPTLEEAKAIQSGHV